MHLMVDEQNHQLSAENISDTQVVVRAVYPLFGNAPSTLVALHVVGVSRSEAHDLQTVQTAVRALQNLQLNWTNVRDYCGRVHIDTPFNLGQHDLVLRINSNRGRLRTGHF